MGCGVHTHSIFSAKKQVCCLNHRVVAFVAYKLKRQYVVTALISKDLIKASFTLEERARHDTTIMADRISVHNKRTVIPSLYTLELWVDVLHSSV